MDEPAHWKAKPHHADYDEMRARLITAAWELASERGVAKLTLNAVAKRAECARSSVYRYFDSKEQLLGEVMRERILSLGEEMKSELARYDDPEEQIPYGVWLAVEAVKHGPSLELIRTLFLEEGGEGPAILLEQVPSMAAQLLGIDPIFAQARAAGRIRDDVSDDEILRWLVMIAASLIQQDTPRIDRDADIAYLRKMLVPSIFKPA